MSDTPQTTVATPTGQAVAAANLSATAGETTKAEGSTTAAAPAKGTLLGGDPGAVKADAGKEQGQTSGENKTTPEAGAELEVKLPEGTVIDQAFLDGYKAVAKEAGLNSEQATKIAAKYMELQSVAEKSQYDAWMKQSDDWEAELKSDKDVGGAAFNDNTAKARAALLKYGGQGLATDLNKYGLGNLPSLFKAWANVGRAIAEDQSATKGSPGGQAELGDKELNKLLYSDGFRVGHK